MSAPILYLDRTPGPLLPPHLRPAEPPQKTADEFEIALPITLYGTPYAPTRQKLGPKPAPLPVSHPKLQTLNLAPDAFGPEMVNLIAQRMKVSSTGEMDNIWHVDNEGGVWRYYPILRKFVWQYHVDESNAVPNEALLLLDQPPPSSNTLNLGVHRSSWPKLKLGPPPPGPAFRKIGKL